MNLFLLGFVAMGCFVAGLFFLRFWRETKDRLFLAFAVSFFVEGVNRTVLALSPAPQEGAPFFYLVRLSTFLIILVAVVDKNRAARASSPPAPPPSVREVPSSHAGITEN
jgi:uncharacterized membrane protein HdeD (DUF308 family)